MVLVRKGDEVYYENRKLTIVKQETKGPGKEVVKIDGLPESNGQKWVSLSRLVEGENDIATQKRDVTISNNRLILTEEEKSRIDELQREIDEIKNNAKSRQPVKVNFKMNISSMSKDEKLEEIEKLKRLLGV